RRRRVVPGAAFSVAAEFREGDAQVLQPVGLRGTARVRCSDRVRDRRRRRVARRCAARFQASAPGESPYSRGKGTRRRKRCDAGRKTEDGRLTAWRSSVASSLIPASMEFELWWLLPIPVVFFALGWIAARIDIRHLLRESSAL